MERRQVLCCGYFIVLILLCLQVFMGIFRFGFVFVYFLQLLFDGFVMGVLVIIFIFQLRYLLGVRVSRYQGLGMVVSIWLSLLRSVGQVNLCDVFISVVCLVVLLVVKEFLDRCRYRLKVSLFTELLVILAVTFVFYLGQFYERFGFSVVGDIFTGFMVSRVSDFGLMQRVALDVVFLVFVVFVFFILLVEMFVRSYGYFVRVNQELLVVGCCNVLFVFFYCFVISVVLVKSLVKTVIGCRTQLFSVVSVVVVLLVLLVLALLFRDLQRSVLVCVIVVSLRGVLRKVRDVLQLWQFSLVDVLVWVVIAVICVLVSIEVGLLVGVFFLLFSLVGRI